jgi:hypothetical protein
MKCEQAIEILTRSSGGADRRRAATEHAADCAECRYALSAVQVLRAEGLETVPPPSAAAFDRAIAAATRQPTAARPPRRAFRSGMGLTSALPRIALAPNEQRDISISLATPEALVDAEIHVVLSGAIGLSGFEGQRELRWRTNLDRGDNQLTLPVVALGTGGGQLLVEVLHGDKRRTFVVDVRDFG